MFDNDNIEEIDSESDDSYSNDDLYNISSWGADLSFRELITMYEEDELQKKSRMDIQRSNNKPIELTRRADETTTMIQLAIYRQDRTSAETLQKIRKTIVWRGVQWDAQQYPELEVINNFAAIERTLLTLITDKPLGLRKDD